MGLDLVLPLSFFMRHRRHRDTAVVEVLATARHARVPPRNRAPVLLEQPLGEFHRHVPAVAWGFLLLGREDPASVSCFVLRNSRPFPMTISVAVECWRGAGRLALFFLFQTLN
jgi:hypothetical protein